jgi:branched-chain amino acid aminotransferase
MVEKVERIWMDGEFIRWDEAKVHILTHTLHYGMGVFEGIRCYLCRDGRSGVFRLKEHIDRLFDSAHIAELEIPFSREEIMEACKETMRANGLKEGYIRPLVFIGDGAMGVNPQDNPIRVAIITWRWGAYLGEEALQQGTRVKISSYARHHVNVMMTKAKICGNYVNSVFAKREAVRGGYDEAIMLDADGYVAEATGENIFMVKNGFIKTPPLTAVLPGITRSAVFTLIADKGMKLIEQRFTRDELYIADEVFITGTAAEITPVREVDDRKIGLGKRGPVTRDIQSTFFKAVHGELRQYQGWISYL